MNPLSSRSSVLFIAAAGASLAAASPAVSSVSVTNMLADNSNNASAFSNLADAPGTPAVAFWRTTGSSYGGIATKVTGGRYPLSPVGTGNSWFGSTAWLRGGVSSGNTNVVMSWRTATTAERIGTSTVPPMPDSAGYNSLSSDVLDLSGIAVTGPMVSGMTPTDAYALEITYSPQNIIQSYQFGNTMGWNLANIYSSGEGQITYYNPSTSSWSKGVSVITPGADKVTNFFGTYDQWVASWNAANPLDQITSTTNLSRWVGSYGFTYANANGVGGAAEDYRMWVIMDHTSVFGATPAPGALALLGMAGVLGGARRRRG